MEQRSALLARQPELQAEAIADHYASMASMACNVLEAIKLRKLGGSTKVSEQYIELFVERIKVAHRMDLGIDLDWKNQEPESLQEFMRKRLDELGDKNAADGRLCNYTEEFLVDVVKLQTTNKDGETRTVIRVDPNPDIRRNNP